MITVKFVKRLYRTNLTKHESSCKHSILYHQQNNPSVLIKTLQICNQ